MSDRTRRIIKRYSNRKLYDTKSSKYVTLKQLAANVRAGEDIQVLDNKTKEDLTSVTLAQIFFAEEKHQRSFLPLSSLRKIMQNSTDSLHDLITQVSESAERMGRVFRSEPQNEAPNDGKPLKQVSTPQVDGNEPGRRVRDIFESAQRAVEDWQHRLDMTIHNTIDNLYPMITLQKEFQNLKDRVTAIETQLNQPLADSPKSQEQPDEHEVKD